MYIVSGGNAKGMVSSSHENLDDALAKAVEFQAAGMTHVGILDLERLTYTPQEIDLLVGITKAEHGKVAMITPPDVATKKPWWKRK